MHFCKYAFELDARSVILQPVKYSVPTIIQRPHRNSDADYVGFDVSKPIVELRVSKASLYSRDDWSLRKQAC